MDENMNFKETCIFRQHIDYNLVKPWVEDIDEEVPRILIYGNSIYYNIYFYIQK